MARKWENAMTIDKRSWGYRRNGKLHEYMSIKVGPVTLPPIFPNHRPDDLYTILNENPKL